MKFRSRLILGYAALAIAASVLFGFFYNYYLDQRYQINIYNNAKFTSSQVLNTLEGDLQKMDQVMLSLLSNLDVLQAIRDLSVKMADPRGNELTISDEKSLIRNTIYTAYNLDNFYRVVVYNRYGYIAASSYMQDRLVDTSVKVYEIPWLVSVVGSKGENVLIAPHADDWAAYETKRSVYSRVKEIQGNNLGFIEVQQSEEHLEELLTFPNETVQGIVLDEKGKVFWTSDHLDAGEYEQYFQLEDSVFDQINVNNGIRELISVDTGRKTGLRLITIQNWSDATATVSNGWESALLIGAIFFIFSLGFIVFMANFLTKPLQELRESMEKTQLTNLNDKIEIKSSDADIKALTTAYQFLLERLSSSIEKEEKLSILQLQAQFDALQAQINPHFIYNVLNVISGRGIQNDDEVICEICGQLASMLRYSTNTKIRYATICEEMEYTREYFFLIKARYGDKVQLNVKMDPSIQNEIVPKTALQQIAENCINHGFHNSANTMCVTINGYSKDGNWYVEILDNGQGFGEEALRALNNKMTIAKRRLFQEKSNIELEIGGMGLINTYIRLLLIYSDSSIFELKNTSDGAMVVLGAKMQMEGLENV